MIKAGIIGGTGYTGVELLRLLIQHPGAEVTTISSRSEKDKNVTDVFPSLRGYTDLQFCDPDEAGLERCDVVFSATPNGVAMTHARVMMDKGVRLIDLSADFRIRDVEEWARWYQFEHACPELLADAVYGLPEINRESIKDAQLVANPGLLPDLCHPGANPAAGDGIGRSGSTHRGREVRSLRCRTGGVRWRSAL